MDLRELLRGIGATYDRALGQGGEAQQLLKRAPAILDEVVPPNFVPDASGGKGNAAVVPWIAVFDPEETETARRGMYVVYLFDAEMKNVWLSLNQGVTELTERFGGPGGRDVLRRQAATIRDKLPQAQTTGLASVIDLRSKKDLPRNYEAGNILGLPYALNDLPTTAALTADLRRFLKVYEIGREVRDGLRISEPEAIVTTRPVSLPTAAGEFKPKNSADYVQQIAARTITKSRSHEAVVKRYGEWLQGRGYLVRTDVHPRDLTATNGSQRWLIEVKVVYRGDGVGATRASLAQLLMYRDYHEDDPDSVRLLAVFSEDVGAMCVEFLERYGIAAVWKSGHEWSGSPSAAAAGLTGPATTP